MNESEHVAWRNGVTYGDFLREFWRSRHVCTPVFTPKSTPQVTTFSNAKIHDTIQDFFLAICHTIFSRPNSRRPRCATTARSTTSKDTVIATIVIMSADVCCIDGRSVLGDMCNLRSVVSWCVCGRGMEFYKTPCFPPSADLFSSGLHRDLKTMNRNAMLTPTSFLYMQKDFHQDVGHSSDLDQRRSGILLMVADHEENGTESLN